MIALTLMLAALGGVPLRAQGPVTAGGALSIDGSAAYGNTRTRLVRTRIQAVRGDSAWEFRMDARGTYSEFESARVPFVVDRRSAFALVSVDHRPEDAWTTFAWVSTEGSLEQRLALRVATAVGVKRTLEEDSLGTVSISLAVQRELNRAFADAPQNPYPQAWRWSFRFRARRRFTASGVSFSHETYWRPLVEEVARYTLTSQTTVAWALTKSMSLTAAWTHLVDTDAITRGAQSNSDGVVTIGLRAQLGGRVP